MNTDFLKNSNMLTILAVIFGALAILFQAWQKTIDDAGNKALSDSLIAKHERLDGLISEANKKLTGLNNFVTGGNNKPLFSYRYQVGMDLRNKSGELIGTFNKINFYVLNRGDTPLSHIKVQFVDNTAHIVSFDGTINESTFLNAVYQIQTIPMLTRGTQEPFYEVRMPSHFNPIYYYDFAIFWEMNWYIIRTEFKFDAEQKSINLTKIDYFNGDRTPILNLNQFLGFKVDDLSDYQGGKLLNKK